MTETLNMSEKFQLKQKYTALWAFSESIFGGILHALRIPFTGLFLGGFAVVFLSLISNVIEKKKEILNITLTVIAIKLILSPNTPATAYLAVLIQGILGFLFFTIIKNRSIAIFLLSFFSSIWSASQKIVLTTLFFGMTFWYSIDQLTNYLAGLVGFNLGEDFSMSLVLIGLYFLIHLAGAVLFAKAAISLPNFIRENSEKLQSIEKELLFQKELIELDEKLNSKSAKKSWYKKPSRMLLIIFLFTAAIITYINPEFGKIKFIDVSSMIIRAALVIFIWFKIISPFISKYLMKVFRNKSDSAQVGYFISLFPEFKEKISYCWKINSSYPKIKRLKRFITDSLLILLR